MPRIRPSRIRALAGRLLDTPEGRPRPLPIERIVAGLGIRLVRSPLEGDDDVSGFYQKEHGREVIGVNSLHAPVRQRFTIAHELGHAVLHGREGLHLDQAFKLRFRNSTSSLAVDSEEMDANSFAAELLMPAGEVRDLLSESGLDVNDDQAVRTLARRFGVSQQAMTFRVVNLGAELDGTARFG
jgi:Zn-dependent peptidase ImmA (M78 family)